MSGIPSTRVTHWSARTRTGCLCVPEWTIRELVQLKRYQPDGDWHIPVVRPPNYPASPTGNIPLPAMSDWYSVLALERGLIEFQQCLELYRDFPEPITPRSDIVVTWRNLRQALAAYDISVPLFGFGHRALQNRADHEDLISSCDFVEEDQHDVLISIAPVLETIVGTITDLDTITLVAHRFVARYHRPCIAWNYPERSLRLFSLPLWQIADTAVEAAGSVEGKINLYESPPRYAGRPFQGFRKTTRLENRPASMVPYRFNPPYVARRKRDVISDFLSPRWAMCLDFLYTYADVKRMIQDGDWPFAKGESRGVAYELEDGGLREEYDRILRIWEDGERKGSLGKIRPSKEKQVAVVVLYGDEALFQWDCRQYRQKWHGDLAPDERICPHCGSISYRARGQHKEKSCPRCAKPETARKDDYRKRKKTAR